MGILSSRPGGMNNGRGDDPGNVGGTGGHGEEGLTRTSRHPLYGTDHSETTVGRYLGSTGTPGQPRTHHFSAEATGGGETDSFTINDSGNDPKGWLNPTPSGAGKDRYTFSRNTSVPHGPARRYNPETDWMHPGAPMSDTKAEHHDRNYR